jgi:hypothetical protein
MRRAKTAAIPHPSDLRFFEARFGTLAPLLRACDNPIAIACLRLLTLRPDRPLLSVPLLRSLIARPTLADAFLEYLRAMATLPFKGGNRHVRRRFRCASIRGPQAISDARLGQDELRPLRIGLDLLPELAHIDP